MRILVVGAHKSMSDGLEWMLKESGKTVDMVTAIDEAVELCHLYGYDILVLDLSVGNQNSLDIIHKLRTRGILLPIIAMADTTDIDFKVDVLNMGADDYLPKPFHMKELIARAHALVRRSQGHAVSAIHIGRLKVDLGKNLAEVNGMTLALTKKEYDILELMAMRKGTLISKQFFLNHLYGGLDEPDATVLDVFIFRLRKKIAKLAHGGNFIKTIWGRGYLLADPLLPLENNLHNQKETYNKETYNYA